MNRLGRIVAVLAMAAGLVVFDAAPAMACSCAGSPPERLYDLADAVFEGEIVEVRSPNGDGRYYSAAPVRYIVHVERVFKGEVFEVQSVVSAASGSSCGVDFGPGETWRINATEESRQHDGPDGELFADLCAGSTRVTAAEAGLADDQWAPPLGGVSAVGSSPRGVSTRGWRELVTALGVLMICGGSLALGFREAAGRRWRP